MSKVPSVKEGQASARGPPRRGPAAAASREAGAPCAAPRGGGSRGGAPTEAFPVGERSAAPRERLPCAPGGSWASLRCPATRPHSGPRAPAPAPARLRAPRIRPLPALPAHPEQPAAALLLGPPPPTAARRLLGGLGVRSVGGWEGDAPSPPPGARPLCSTPGTSYRRFSAELRPAPGVDRTVPLQRLARGSGRRQVGES